MAIDFEITVDNSAEVLQELALKVEGALTACGEQAIGYAVDIITAAGRIKSGNMKDNISSVVQENTCYVGTNTEYAIYHEFGTGIYAEGGKGRQTPWFYVDSEGQGHYTRGVKPIHFLKNALADHKADYKSIIEEELRK